MSGWWLLLKQIFTSTPTLSLTDIQFRLAYVSCVPKLEEAKATPGCIYLKPPVGHFTTLDFGKFDQIYAIGYAYGKETISQWEANGFIKTLKGEGKESNIPRARRNSI